MKSALFILLICTLFPGCIYAQFFCENYPRDSFVIHFGIDGSYIDPDTATTPLWQFGGTYKTFFGPDTMDRRMTTDTLSPYPRNTNNFFVAHIPHRGHSLVTFWHRFQTDSGRDGGIVEYSLDNGVTWWNVVDSCNIDGDIDNAMGIITKGFYKLHDKVIGDNPAFSGSCDTTRVSKFQFAGGYAIKSTAGNHCNFYPCDTIYVRFRFISDTVSDSMAGWSIDSLKVNYFQQLGEVSNLHPKLSFKVSPNPSSTGRFSLSTTEKPTVGSIRIFDITGRKLEERPFADVLDLSRYPKASYICEIRYENLLHTLMLHYQ